MCPELQYRAEFPVHFPLSVLTFSGQIKELAKVYRKFCPIYGNFIFFSLCQEMRLSGWRVSECG